MVSPEAAVPSHRLSPICGNQLPGKSAISALAENFASAK